MRPEKGEAMTDREKLIEILKLNLFLVPSWRCTYEEMADSLLADGVVVREKGEWVLGHIEPGYFTPGGNRPWMCSKCGRCESWMLDKPKTNFCHNCGADMRKGENG